MGPIGSTSRIGVTLALFLLAVPAGADVPVAQRAEVDHLLAFIADSGCSMQRNGKTYPPDQAVRHVTRKYNHFREQITSTEAFVRQSATRSERSGQAYLALCPGQPPKPAGEWLMEELQRFRSGSAGGFSGSPAASKAVAP